MTEKTFNTLTALQKILLLVMAVACVAFEIIIVMNARLIDDLNLKISAYNLGITNLAWALAMVCGFLYAMKGYTKEAGSPSDAAASTSS